MPDRTKLCTASELPAAPVLRGAGVTMALPWLESLHASGRYAGTGRRFPKRFAVLFMGNGINEDHWSAEGPGADMVLSKTLAPLEPLKQKINFIDGLFNKDATGQGHSPRADRQPALRRAHPEGRHHPFRHLDRSDDRQPSRRRHAAIEHRARLRAAHDGLSRNQLLAGLQLAHFLADAGFAGSRGTLPVARLRQPVRESRQPAQYQHSRPRERPRRSLSRKISSTDKTKLDEYLTSVREVEKRVEGMRKAKDMADDPAKAEDHRPSATMERPANGLPDDLREHARLMCDIIAIAFQTDKTRVATLFLARDLSAIYYPFLDVKDGHHGASHNNNSDGYERITRFHLSQFAYLATKLDSMPEGDGTVLDNSCLMFISNLWIGRTHNNSRLPLVLAGGLGGTLQTGRTLDYIKAGDENRKMCSLYLSLMDRYGIKLDRFGDADTRLERI